MARDESSRASRELLEQRYGLPAGEELEVVNRIVYEKVVLLAWRRGVEGVGVVVLKLLDEFHDHEGGGA